MRPQTITTEALTDDANGIFEDQTTSGAGELTLNGALVTNGVAHCYGEGSDQKQAQPVSIEGSGDNSGVTATITGTGPGDEPVVEDLTLANASTATTNAYFKSVSKIEVDSAVTGDIEGGWVASNGMVTMSFKADRTQTPFNQSHTVNVISGTLTYSVQFTVDSPRDDYGNDSFETGADWRDVDGLSAVSSDNEGNIAYPVEATRLKFSSYTSGTAKYTAIQGHNY